MNCFERDCGNIREIYVPVNAAVETKVAEIRRNSIGIGRVVAEDCNRNAILCVGTGQPLQGVGDVEVKLVIAALMRSDQQRPDPKRGRLARTLKVQDGSPLDKGITQRKPRTVPSLATKIRFVRVAGVIRIEAVRKNRGLPQTARFGMPNLSDAGDRATTELPSCIQPLDGFGRSVFSRSGHHGTGARWSGEQNAGGGNGRSQQELPSRREEQEALFPKGSSFAATALRGSAGGGNLLAVASPSDDAT